MPEKKPTGDLSDYYSLMNTIIVAINILIFLLVDLSNSSENTDWMLKWGAMYWPYVRDDGQIYRFITCMFLHFGVAHLFNNMLMLWFLGGTLEKIIGSVKYVFLYFLSGILAEIVSIRYNILCGTTPVSAGASGAIFGITGALLFVVLINKGRAEGITTRQMMIIVALSIYGGFANQGIDNAAHIGGFISGFLLAAVFYRRPKKLVIEEDGGYDFHDEN